MAATQKSAPQFLIEVGDEAYLTVEEIWPDGDAPANPTVEDVAAQIKKSSRFNFARDWGFEDHVSVNGKPVEW